MKETIKLLEETKTAVKDLLEVSNKMTQLLTLDLLLLEAEASVGLMDGMRMEGLKDGGSILG